MTRKVIFSFAAIAAMHSVAIAGGDISPVGPIVETVETSEMGLENYSLGLKVGTLGLGVDFSIPITESVNVRFNVNGLAYSYDTTEDDVEYDVDATFLTAGVLLDYYPIDDSTFRISAGAYYNGNDVTGTALPGPGGEYEIGDGTYTGAEIGSLEMGTDIDKFSPYVGIGWGSAVTPSGWSFTVDLGVLYQGSTEITSDLTYGASPLTDAEKAQIQSDVNKEVQSLNNDIRDYKYYPVIMVGMSYAF